MLILIRTECCSKLIASDVKNVVIIASLFIEGLQSNSEILLTLLRHHELATRRVYTIHLAHWQSLWTFDAMASEHAKPTQACKLSWSFTNAGAHCLIDDACDFANSITEVCYVNEIMIRFLTMYRVNCLYTLGCIRAGDITRK